MLLNYGAQEEIQATRSVTSEGSDAASLGFCSLMTVLAVGERVLHLPLHAVRALLCLMNVISSEQYQRESL